MAKHFHIIPFISAIIFMASCGNGNVTNNEDNSSQIPVTEGESAHESADAVTGATMTADKPTFNGIIDVDPRAKATISMAMGGTVHSLNVISGQHLRKGDIIATIDNLEYISLQQECIDASAQLEFIETEYLRQLSLSEQNAVSKKTLQQAKADYLSLKSRCNSLKAKLKILGTDIESLAEGKIEPYMTIKAPINGYVTSLNANIGKYIDVGESLCMVIDKSRPRIVMTVYEKDLSYIGIGKKMMFKINGIDDKEFEAVIDAVDQVVDQTDYSIKVYASVNEFQEEFRPGMYVRARFAD